MKTRRVKRILARFGWSLKRSAGSHMVYFKKGHKNLILSYKPGEEIGWKMLTKISKITGIPREGWRTKQTKRDRS
jgi:predicted RNA binding protein YcfA (HicA-like mRNA interferase family)